MRFPYLSPTTRKGEGSLMPYLPLKLHNKDREIRTHGLLDTGATVNVLPYKIGLDLGFVWNEQTIPLKFFIINFVNFM